MLLFSSSSAVGLGDGVIGGSDLSPTSGNNMSTSAPNNNNNTGSSSEGLIKAATLPKIIEKITRADSAQRGKATTTQQ
jgi:hypothetical protein